jgi:hypothetical protein
LVVTARSIRACKYTRHFNVIIPPVMGLTQSTADQAFRHHAIAHRNLPNHTVKLKCAAGDAGKVDVLGLLFLTLTGDNFQPSARKTRPEKIS